VWGIRNGDNPSAERHATIQNPPQILITTPESLSGWLAGKAPAALFRALRRRGSDEWHAADDGQQAGSQSGALA